MRVALLLLMTILLSGCITIESSAPTTFYLLTVESSAVPDSSSADGLSIGLGPLKLPDYLKRPQIVSRDGQNGAVVADFHHWAGELEQNMMGVLTQQLAEEPGIDLISGYPWGRHRVIRYQVKLDILRFDGGLSGEVALIGSWSLLDDAGRKELAIYPFSLSVDAGAGGYSGYVAALNRLLLQLGRQIGSEVANNHAGRVN
ncbi:MAG: PqiC family protein [Sedimenticola sp.]